MEAEVTVRDESRELAARLESDPGRFEPTTAFRVAQSADGPLDVVSHIGVTTAVLPVDGFRRRDDGGIVVRSTLPGLLGPLGALPPAYGELAMREERNRSRGLTAFFDLFSARIAELFVEACEKYRLPRLLRWSERGGRNAFLTTLFSLAGFGTARLRRSSGVHETLILRFAGLFAARTRNASNLAAMLREFTGLPVRVELFRGRWIGVPPEEQTRLGGDGARLGVNAMAGAAVHDFAGGFRVVVGPVDYADYLTLTPGSRAPRELFALTRLFVGSGLDFDVQIVLKREQIPFCQLGSGEKPRLGWNSWARVAPAARDSGDAVITQSALALGAAE